MIETSMTADHQVIGKIGRLTGSIAPGEMGEVMLPVRGGTEAYYCYSSDPQETIAEGSRVIVVEHEPPRTVIVSRYG